MRRTRREKIDDYNRPGHRGTSVVLQRNGCSLGRFVAILAERRVGGAAAVANARIKSDAIPTVHDEQASETAGGGDRNWLESYSLKVGRGGFEHDL